LTSIKDSIVIDIGGTSSDVGMLINGFPRPASAYVMIGGVRTHFRMPDTISIALGGGSIITFNENDAI
jgi:N-methylhydantoinase A/oxoprolinase/acetone carboxylase beta subunit